MSKLLPSWVALVLTLALAGCSSSRQVVDLAFAPPVARPAFAAGEGPVVLVDEAHNNFHTVDERYRPFAELLRRDGYVVRGLAAPFTAEALAEAKVLVIANALAKEDEKWKLPTPPAFTAEEVAAVEGWVAGGGSLLLIADHMPFPGAAEELAAAFDVYFTNGFAFDGDDKSRLVFERSTGSLKEHPITDGRELGERIEAVKTFTGQAFRADREVSPLLVLPAGSRVRLPVKAWKLSERTPEVPAAGLFQGAVFAHGSGRVAVFGEAAMFSAQRTISRQESTPTGMNAEGAEQNPQLLLNVLHWLSRLLG